MTADEFRARLERLANEVSVACRAWHAYKAYKTHQKDPEYERAIAYRNGFLNPAFGGLSTFALISLARLLDGPTNKDGTESLSLDGLLLYARRDKATLVSYAGANESERGKELRRIRRLLGAQDGSRKILRAIRNKRLAHLDADPLVGGSIQMQAFEDLLGAIQSTVDELWCAHSGEPSRWPWEQLGRNAETDTDIVIRGLDPGPDIGIPVV